MYFELREYRLLPGERDKYAKFMEEKVIPFFASKGKLCFGSFLSLDDPDVYIWIFGRFENQEERKQWSAKITKEEYYQREIQPPARKMFGVKEPPESDRITVTRLKPTTLSFIK